LDASNLAEIQTEIESLERQKQQLLRQQRGLDARRQTLSTLPQVNKTDLRGALSEFIPEHLMPGNVGAYTSVVWPFWFPVDFDFGTNPLIQGGGLTTQVQNFQVSQEGAILMIGISRQADSYSTSGHLGPWTLEIRDNQSARQFNDRPLPIQMISDGRGRPSKLPIAMLLMPNALISVTMSNWLPQGFNQATVGSGHHQFAFFGYRVRIEDAEKVLSTVYSGQGLGQ
jgi:hypothetical protein